MGIFSIWKGMVFMTNIYAPLKRYFLSLFFTLALSLISYIISSDILTVVISVFSIIFSVIQIHAIYCMRNSCERIRKSFNFFILSLVGMIISLIITILGIYSDNISIALFSVIIMIVFACFSIVADFQLIWGLDELIVKNGYNYPQGKIKWMFWFSIINALISGSLVNTGAIVQALIIGTVCSVCSLWLLYEYLQAVNEKENNQI